MLRRLPILMLVLALVTVAWLVSVGFKDPIEVTPQGSVDDGNIASAGREEELAPRLHAGEVGLGGSPGPPNGARQPAAPTPRGGSLPSTVAERPVPSERAPPGAVGRFDVLVRGPAGEEVAAADANVIDAQGSRLVHIERGHLTVWLRDSDRPLQLEVFRARGADGSAAAWGWAVERIDSAGTGRALELRLPKELTLAGSVADGSGAPVVGVRVEVTALLPEPLTRGGDRVELASEGRTDGAGRFVLRGLGAGDVAVDVTPPPTLQRIPKRRVRAGDQFVHIVLEHAARVAVRVLDAAGRPVQGALVWASRQDPDAPGVEPLGGVGYGRDNLTDAQGTWAIPHLAKDRLYRLRVEPPRGRTDLVRQELTGWSPADTTVRLASGGSVRGVVRDAAGDPLRQVSLYHRQAGDWQSGDVDSAGRFEIGGLDPGEVTLRATTAPDGLATNVDGLPMFAERRVAVGNGDVTLTVERGRELVVHLDGWPGDRGIRKGLLFAEGLLRGRTWTIGSRVEPDGRVRFQGLEATGTYSFWLPPEGGEQSALVDGIRGEVGAIHVPVTAGLTIRGRLLRPEGGDAGVVQAFLRDRPFHVETIPDADGSFILRGVPRGTRWRVIGACHVSGAYRSCEEADVPAGGNVDLTPGIR